MASTQTRIRRGTAAQCDAMTPASSEVIHDTTNDRLRAGNGSTAGGIVLPNFKDLQNQTFVTGTVGGTADVITLTLAPIPAGYVANMAIEFKASATNTTNVTININGLGAKAIQTVKAGVLSALVAGDLISGVIYRCTYDGTQFQLIGASGGTTQASTVETSNESVVTKYISPDRLKYSPLVAKAWGQCVVSGVGATYTLTYAYGVTVVAGPKLSFTTALASANYTVLITQISAGASGGARNKTTTDFQFQNSDGTYEFIVMGLR